MESPEQEVVPDQWYIGVVIYVTGCIINALGATLIKHSLNQELEKNAEERRPDCARPLWLCGFTMFVGSGIMLSIALNFATQAMLSPLMSVVLLATVLFAHFILGEKVTLKDCLAIIFIIAGVIMTTIGAPKENPSFTQEQLIDLYRQPSFIIFILAWLSLQIICYGFYFYLKPRVFSSIIKSIENQASSESELTKSEEGIKKQDKVLVEDIKPKAGNYDGSDAEMKSEVEIRKNIVNESPYVGLQQHASEQAKGQELEQKPKQSEIRIFALLFGIIAGLWGGFCVTLMKSTITIIVAEVTQFGFLSLLQSFLMYVLIFMLAITWLMQLKWLNFGLQFFPAMFIISVEAIVNEVTSVMGGLFYFQEIYNFTDENSLLFSLGLVMAVIGVGIIGSRDNVELNEYEEKMKEGIMEERNPSAKAEQDPPKPYELNNNRTLLMSNRENSFVMSNFVQPNPKSPSQF